jgi:hypothetical protein
VSARHFDYPPLRLRLAPNAQAGLSTEANKDRASRKRPGEAVDAHARTSGRGNRHAAADLIRAVIGTVTMLSKGTLLQVP